ncbi:MAG: ABC transporter ATP-binding protein [Oscillospiraceae bacterium]|nr:ABC transporter ATP-binding protein [Oscillospiraceae bacterium]
MNAISVKDLTITYHGGKKPDFSFGPVTLELPKGAILGLLGENGAGKTTLMKLILGLRRPQSGEISLLDGVPGQPAIMENVGVVLDEPGVPACLTPVQLGKVLGRIYHSWDPQRYAQYLRQLQLPENKPFSEFSKGMKTKLSIAAALGHCPKLLILDEPTSGLDPLVREEMLELLSDFTRDPEHSILISSHIVGDLEKLCDYVAFLHHGTLLLCEEKDRVLEQYGILHGSASEIDALDPQAVLHQERSAYGVEALVRRALVPQSLALRSATLEEIFVGMIKEEA